MSEFGQDWILFVSSKELQFILRRNSPGVQGVRSASRAALALEHGKLHQLAGHWSVTVSGNWLLTFRFERQAAVLVDYQDYH